METILWLVAIIAVVGVGIASSVWASGMLYAPAREARQRAERMESIARREVENFARLQEERSR